MTANYFFCKDFRKGRKLTCVLYVFSTKMVKCSDVYTGTLPRHVEGLSSYGSSKLYAEPLLRVPRDNSERFQYDVRNGRQKINPEIRRRSKINH